MQSPENQETYFCFLVITTKHKLKVNTYVGLSHNPYKKLGALNKKKTRVSHGDGTKDWQMELIIGPFNNKTIGNEFKETWKRSSRGIRCRREKGLDMAKQWRKICWDKRHPESDSSSMDTMSGGKVKS